MSDMHIKLKKKFNKKFTQFKCEKKVKTFQNAILKYLDMLNYILMSN